MDDRPLTIINRPSSVVYRLHPVLQNFLRCQHPRRAHDPATGVCACRAEVVAFERGAEVCPLRGGSQEEDLVQQQFAVEDVAARDARDGFDVFR
jgi:hypothetical protein